MADTVRIEGWKEFITDLRYTPARIRQDMTKTLRTQGSRLTARAAIHAPKRSGNMANHTSIRVTPNRLVVVWTEPYAPVQEFARDYTRGGDRGGPVHMTGTTPRFAYRAWNELAPSFGEAVLDAVARAAASGGFWRVVS